MYAAKMAKKQAKKQQWFNFNKAIILLFLLAVIGILKTALAPNQIPELPEEGKTDLAVEAGIVLGKFIDGDTEVSLLDSNELIEEKVAELEQMDYDEIKDLLGIENDFCVFFEDVTGDIIKVDGVVSGMGSDKIYINGEPCR